MSGDTAVASTASPSTPLLKVQDLDKMLSQYH